MCKYHLKSILIAVITVALLLVAAPTVASASMDLTSDDCDSNLCNEKASIPMCCLTADCPLSHCILTNAINNEIIITSRPFPNENVQLTWFRTSVSTDMALNPKNPIQLVRDQESPSYFFAECRCRNCLDSEEPPQD